MHGEVDGKTFEHAGHKTGLTKLAQDLRVTYHESAPRACAVPGRSCSELRPCSRSRQQDAKKGEISPALAWWSSRCFGSQSLCAREACTRLCQHWPVWYPLGASRTILLISPLGVCNFVRSHNTQTMRQVRHSFDALEMVCCNRGLLALSFLASN